MRRNELLLCAPDLDTVLARVFAVFAERCNGGIDRRRDTPVSQYAEQRPKMHAVVFCRHIRMVRLSLTLLPAQTIDIEASKPKSMNRKLEASTKRAAG